MAACAVTGCAAASLAGCSPKLSPLESRLGPTTFDLAGRGTLEIPLELASRSPLRIVVTSDGVDVQGSIVDIAGNPSPRSDSPNRRMGVETLLLEPGTDATVTLRIQGIDHAGASGQVTVEVVALPVATSADRRRLEATQAEARACRGFANPERGESAANEFATAAALHLRNHDSLAAGRALLHEAGTRYDRLFEWRRSAELAERAARRLEAAGDVPRLVYAERLQGAALDAVAQLPDTPTDRRAKIVLRARELLTRAADRFDDLGRPYDAGYALNYRGVSFHYAGEVGQARADYQAALERFRQSGDKPAQALSLQSLALLSHEDGRLSDAVKEFDAALALLEQSHDATDFAHTLHNSALPLQGLGRFDEALSRYLEAARILREAGDRNGEARALQGLGMTLRSLGESSRARTLIQAALDIRMAHGSAREQAASLAALGQIELADGNVDTAIAHQVQAVERVTAPADRARALLALGQSYLSASRLTEARHTFEELLALDLPPTNRFVAGAWTELGTVSSRAGETAAAFAAFERALTAYRQTRSELDEARALQRRAAARMSSDDLDGVLGDTANALALFSRVGALGTYAEQRAAFLAAQRGAAELRITALMHKARDALQTGQLQEADRLQRAALATSDAARAHLLAESLTIRDPGGSQSARAVARVDSLYELLAGKRDRRDRLLESQNPDMQTLSRLAAEIELLRTEAAVLESRSQPRADASSSLAYGIDQRRPVVTVPAGTLALEYFLGDAQSWLFLVGKDGITVHDLPARRDLEQLARQLHEAWGKPADGRSDRTAAAQALARVLFGPVGSIHDAERLVIVPDGALHIIPMAVLATDALSPLIGEAPDIVIGPSLGILGMTRRSPAVGEQPDLIAVIADPIYAPDDPRIQARSRPDSDVVAGESQSESTRPDSGAEFELSPLAALQRLPSAAIEARNIAALIDDPSRVVLRTGPEASVASLNELPFSRVATLHFATHAWADSEDSALGTVALARWDAAGRPLNPLLYARDISRLPLAADLVVLSACETALGREVFGEAPMSIAHSFLRAGARSVVSTLWKVPDTSTAVLMKEFYRQMLQEHRSPQAALQRAQESLRVQPRWSDPHYWAGFQLVTTEH